jgi:hypothetical protein
VCGFSSVVAWLQSVVVLGFCGFRLEDILVLSRKHIIRVFEHRVVELLLLLEGVGAFETERVHIVFGRKGRLATCVEHIG